MSSKKNKGTKEIVSESNTVETPVTETAVETTNELPKMPGRPVNMNSKRQKELLAKEIRRMTGGGGETRKGRPADPNSKRQQKLADRAAKKSAGLLTPGRPKYTPEQKAEADRIKALRKKEAEERVRIEAQKLIEEGKASEILGIPVNVEAVTVSVEENN